jgi:hypothetical protein
MRKYQEEFFTADMDFKISASPYGDFDDEDFEIEDEDFDEDAPIPKVEYPSNCPNCGDEIAYYVPPSPFPSGGLLVGLFIPSRHYLCRHCLTDRAMIGGLPIWNKIIQLREVHRTEKFDHQEFLNRELLLLESEVSISPVPEVVMSEVMEFIERQKDNAAKPEELSQVRFSADGPYTHLRRVPWNPFRPIIIDPPSHQNAVELNDIVQNWDSATQTTSLRIPFETLIAQLDVARIGPLTSMWYRAFTIRQLIDNPEPKQKIFPTSHWDESDDDLENW